MAHHALALSFALLFLGLLRPLPSVAVESLAAHVTGIEGFYGSLTSLGFNFEQQSHSGGSRRLGSGSGLLYKERGAPGESVRGMMRWDYRKPEAQVIISDGETLSVYSPEDQQMIVSTAAQLETDILYRLFLRERELLADFLASTDETRTETGVPEQVMLRLIPRLPHPQIREILLWTDSGFRIQRIRMLDQFGGETQLLLSQQQENPLADRSPEQAREIFRFSPPAGTDIIRN